VILNLFDNHFVCDGSKDCMDGASDLGRKFNVVATALSGLEETSIKAANAPELDLDRIRVYPSMEAFVIGY